LWPWASPTGNTKVESNESPHPRPIGPNEELTDVTLRLHDNTLQSGVRRRIVSAPSHALLRGALRALFVPDVFVVLMHSNASTSFCAQLRKDLHDSENLFDASIVNDADLVHIAVNEGQWIFLIHVDWLSRSQLDLRRSHFPHCRAEFIFDPNDLCADIPLINSSFERSLVCSLHSCREHHSEWSLSSDDGIPSRRIARWRRELVLFTVVGQRKSRHSSKSPNASFVLDSVTSYYAPHVDSALVACSPLPLPDASDQEDVVRARVGPLKAPPIEMEVSQ